MSSTALQNARNQEIAKIALHASFLKINEKFIFDTLASNCMCVRNILT